MIAEMAEPRSTAVLRGGALVTLLAPRSFPASNCHSASKSLLEHRDLRTSTRRARRRRINSWCDETARNRSPPPPAPRVRRPVVIDLEHGIVLCGDPYLVQRRVRAHAEIVASLACKRFRVRTPAPARQVGANDRSTLAHWQLNERRRLPLPTADDHSSASGANVSNPLRLPS